MFTEPAPLIFKRSALVAHPDGRGPVGREPPRRVVSAAPPRRFDLLERTSVRAASRSRVVERTSQP